MNMKLLRRFFRIPITFLLFVGILTAELPPFATLDLALAQSVTPPFPQAATTTTEAKLRLIPADLIDGAPTTINLDPTEVPAGQSVAVSGQGAPGSTKVLLAVVTDGKMLVVKEVDVDSAGTYAAELPIGGAYPPGATQLCALAANLENAEVSCADLLVEPPPNGTLEGQLPLPTDAVAATALDAEIRLMNGAGSVLYAAPLHADGSFALADVPPGIYLYGIAGVVPHLAEMGTVQIEPLKSSILKLAIQKQCGITELRQPTTPLTVNASRTEFVRKARYNGLYSDYVNERRPFGVYVAGVDNEVTFTAMPQSTSIVDGVIFEFFGTNGQLIEQRPLTPAPYAVTFNVGKLPASQGRIHPFVSITPVINGQKECASLYDIEVINDPMASPYMQPFPTSRTEWDGGSRSYRFEGMIPYVEGALPADQILAEDVPLLGTIRNRFNAGLAVKGYFDLEGKARLLLAEALTEAVFLSLPVIVPGDSRENITPPGIGQVIFDIRNPQQLVVPFGPLTLFQKDLIAIPFTKIPIFTLFGIVNAYIGGSLNFAVGLYLEGEMRPLVPAVDTTLSGVGSFRAEIGLSIDLLFGLAEGGGGLGGEVCAGAPLRIILADEPAVFFDNPYLGGRLYVVAWASAFWGLVKTRTTTTIANFGQGCPSTMRNNALTAAQRNEPEPVVPELFASPAVAAAASGRVLAAYVENRAALGATPQVQIIARFQDVTTGEWGDAEALSNPIHSAQSPTVAFIGPNQTPMVAWTENTLTGEEAAAIGEEDNEQAAAAHMQHQEIFYALWNDGWSTPIALTDDELGDGLPEAAGSQMAGLLAWTRDMDGDAATRSDQQIAVSTYDFATLQFEPPTLLAGANGMNGDVSVALNEEGLAVVAWVNDADGDLSTADDRRIEAAHNPRSEWVMLNPQPLPPRVDSPAVTISSAGIQLAFLVREASPDGTVGLLGTNGMLWTALYNGDMWTANPVLDNSHKQVYGEQPALSTVGDESLLLFRHFGDASYRSGLGQISMSRILNAELPSPPLDLTNAADQQWLPTLTINPQTRQALVLHSALASASQATINAAHTSQAKQALPSTTRARLLGGASPVEFLAIDDGGDPALDPLQVSVSAPAPGATVNITVTVRNVGRGVASDLRLDLYRGAVENGDLLDEQAGPVALAFNETATVIFSIVISDDLAPTGDLPLVVQLVTGDANLNVANDSATVTLGGLSAPGRMEIVGENLDFTGALDLVWSGNQGEYVTGYRIFQSSTASGPWRVIGESVVPAFTDTLLENSTGEQTEEHCYRVQAYNRYGALSPYSQAACDTLNVPSLPTTNIYLPLVMR